MGQLIFNKVQRHFNKVQRQFSGERTVSSTNGARAIRNPYSKHGC